MIIANATGCSMIWGSMFPSNPYAVKKESGRGPAYGHSLFEDAAEYGWGIVNSLNNRRMILIDKSKNLVKTLENGELKKTLEAFTKFHNNREKCEVTFTRDFADYLHIICNFNC
jgi:pyruvate-ferredoxin/flavodoxin oxidoreductase